MLFYKAFKIQDYKTALSVQKSLCELLGLEKPTKIAQTDPEGNDKSPIHISIINTEQLPKSEDDVNLQ